MLIVVSSDNVRRRFAQFENFGLERLTYYLVEAPTSYASASASIVIIRPVGGDKIGVFAL